MIVTGSIQELRELRRQAASQSVGLVPTMGYLHKGHVSLARSARQENELVVVSIYVNPTQFAPHEDLTTYPRDLERDIALLAAEGVDIVFTPSNETMYPDGFQTTVTVGGVTQYLEGATRPTHFSGVTTIVSKLFNIIQPTRAYFGQKDAQQTVVVRRMVTDLNFPVNVIICPTVREPDGLAMSSRNKYLTTAERAAAPLIFRTLQEVRHLWERGERNADTLRHTMQQSLASEPLATVDYVSVADPESLVEWTEAVPPTGRALISLAVRFGQTRLIDNILID